MYPSRLSYSAILAFSILAAQSRCAVAEVGAASAALRFKPGIARIVVMYLVRSFTKFTLRIKVSHAILIDKHGDLLVRCHVVAPAPDGLGIVRAPFSIEVIFPDQPRRGIRATVKRCDKGDDIAIIHAPGIERDRVSVFGLISREGQKRIHEQLRDLIR
jgi:hypothetical protein